MVIKQEETNMSDYSHRRSRAAVRLCDASGKPLANADVSYKLVNHEFLFGCGAFDTLPATDVGIPADMETYQRDVKQDRQF